MKKKALVIGVTGQDGAYLSEFLLKKDYQVHGVKRRSSSFNTGRIDHLFKDPHEKPDFLLHYGDLSDSTNLIRLIQTIEPDEIYNLGAMSHVRVCRNARCSPSAAGIRRNNATKAAARTYRSLPVMRGKATLSVNQKPEPWIHISLPFSSPRSSSATSSCTCAS